MSRAEFTRVTKREALRRSGTLCEAVGCGKSNFRRGYCAMHYTRLLRHGAIDDAVLAKARNGAPLQWLCDHARHRGDGCLTYPFAKGRSGKVTVRDGRRLSAFAVMCELAYGPKPSLLHEAAHNCGKGHEACIHPQHLRWATHAENLADRIEHGTSNRGEQHGLSRFTVADILTIRADLRRGDPQSAVAQRFSTSQGTISKIARGERWGWLNG